MKSYFVHCILLILSILFAANAQVKRMTITPSAVASMNMYELSIIDKTKFVYPEFEGKVGPNIFPMQPLRKSSVVGKDVVSNILGVPSPAPSANLLAQADVATIPQGFSWIPPDTWGAIGKTHLMSVHNNNVKIQDRNGVQLQLFSLATWWAPVVPAGTLFDPKIVYDQYNDRWIMVSLSDPSLITSSLLVAISNTNDPTGAWTEYKWVMGVNIQGNNCWADWPCIGFNKNWVAISVNMFTIATGMFQESRVLVMSYPDLLKVKLPFPTNTLFFGIGDFTLQPCVTYSATEDILYVPNSIWGVAGYKLNYITGTSNAPIYNTGVTMMHTVLSNWVGNLGDILPQLPEPGTGTITKIDADDDRINNAVFRNKNIYYSQTVGLPAVQLTHTAAQWVVLDTAANYIQGGRIEDPLATSTNGKPWYAYPSISVNGYGDILVGFSQFSSTQAAASGYCLKDRTDAINTMRDPWIYKPGISYYWKTFSESRNRWGDFSIVQPDPTDNYNFWTIQEYAATKVGVGNGSGRWGTWWAKVQPVSAKTPFSLTLILRIEGRTNKGTGQMVPDTVSCIFKNAASPYTTVDSLKVYLNANGQGIASFNNTLINTFYYLVIKHRNSVETWSHLLNFPIYNPTYDFTMFQNQAYGSNQIQVATKWCIYTGDVNQDGYVTGDDYTGVDNDNSAFTYHIQNDLNGDGYVTGDDYTCIDNNSSNFIQRQVPADAPLATRVNKLLKNNNQQ